MASSPFRIFKRSTKSGTVYYARFIDADGSVILTRALPDAKSIRAARLAADAMRQDVAEAIADKVRALSLKSDIENPDVLSYLFDFWKDDSDYVKGRKLRGVSMSESHVENSRKFIARHATPYLKGLRVRDVGPEVLES